MINLDMDGVLVDLINGLHRMHSRKPLVIKPGTYDYSEILGWTVPWDRLSIQWWANLPRTEFASSIVEELLARYTPSQIRILTKYVSPAAAAGKIVWMKYNYPRISEQIVLVHSDKSFACRDNDLLIDDYEENIIAWRAVGGSAITVPQPWNTLHGSDVMAHLERELNVYRDTEHG